MSRKPQVSFTVYLRLIKEDGIRKGGIVALNSPNELDG